jgi:hypothetical protein
MDNKKKHNCNKNVSLENKEKKQKIDVMFYKYFFYKSNIAK